MGRTPKPTALKAFEGGRSHLTKAEIAKQDNEPRPPNDCPSAPSWLDAGARRKWRELCDILNVMGVVTSIDGDVLAIYCQAYADHERLVRYLRKNGEVTESPQGYAMPRPEVSLRNRARDDLRKAGAELGIGAASRAKIEVKRPNGVASPLSRIRKTTQR